MSTLEKRIKLRKQEFYEKFEKKERDQNCIEANARTGFTDGWDKGWGNHGGPPSKRSLK